MNPYVSLKWMDIAFPLILHGAIVIQLWRLGPFRHEFFGRAGLVAIVISFAGISYANLCYTGAVNVGAVWPTVGFNDQAVVTPADDVYIKIKDPILGRADRVQRYSCRGALKAVFQPDNAGGLYKIAVNQNQTLSIYSVRTDSIDTFSNDGTFLRRREVDGDDMPFDFLKPGPSVTKGDDCEFLNDPDSGRPAVKNGAGVWQLERGDWVLEYALNRQNLIVLTLSGVLLLLISYARNSPRNNADKAS